jgi:sRNA-binding carbon storage regulator CsrA
MLVLTRQTGEAILLNFSQMTDAELLALRTAEPIRVTVVSVRGDKVRLGITAPQSVKVNRSE